MFATRMRGVLGAAGAAALALSSLALTVPALADGPPGPPPYPKIFLTGTQNPGYGTLECTDAAGTVLYSGRAWTLEPLVRGPLFAPVALWLADAGNQAVVPLRFEMSGESLEWVTVDSGPVEAGDVWGAAGRPVAFGPPVTDTSPMVTCTPGYDTLGWWDFGNYRITPALASMLGLPADLVGRTVNFSNEGTVTFYLPRTQFPLTAAVKAPVLATPDLQSYSRVGLGGTSFVVRDAHQVVKYRGRAFTFAPLVRGYQWAPIALWLAGDRIVTPRYFVSSSSGTWKTVSGTPARSGSYSTVQSGRPSGYGTPAANPGSGDICSWHGTQTKTLTVGKALVAELHLPADLVGRQVTLSGSYTIKAYVPAWLWPPAS